MRGWVIFMALLCAGPAQLAHAQDEAAAATAELERVLRQQHAREMPSHRIRTRRMTRSYGTTVQSAVVPPLYPGTGIAAVVLGPDGRSYGQHGQHDLAELVRALGWLRAAPSAADVKGLLSDALFNGLLASHDDGEVRLERGGLVYTVVRAHGMSGQAVERLELRVGPRGDARLTRSPAS